MLKFYFDASLQERALFPHVSQSGTRIHIQIFLRTFNTDKSLHVAMRKREVPASEDTKEPLQQVYATLPNLLLELSDHKHISHQLVTKARRALGLFDKEV